MAINPKYSFGNKLFILVHPGMIALYVFFIVLYFVPNYFDEYLAEITDTELLKGNLIYYHDLDNDGITEKLRYGYNAGDVARISVRNLNESIINQWNFRGDWSFRNKVFFGDYNHNGFSETYCFTIVDDSVFLHINEIMHQDGLNINHKYICKAGLFNKAQNDIHIVGGKVTDINHDGMDDFIFVLYGGYSKFPRNVFVYDIINDAIIRSPKSASGISYIAHFLDLNDDGIVEICGSTSAHENIHYEMPYTDSSSWVMVFNPADSLNFLFEPIRFNTGIGSIISSVPFNINGNKFIASSFYNLSSKTKGDHYWLKTFDPTGFLVKERKIKFNEYGNLVFINPFNGEGNNFYLTNERWISYVTDINFNFSAIKSKKPYFKLSIPDKYTSIDIGGDSLNEILFVDRTDKIDKLIIFDSDMTSTTSVDLIYSERSIYHHICVKKDNRTKKPVLVFQNQEMVYYIKYQKNSYYLLQYPIYIIVYSLIFLLFWLLQKVQNTLAKRKFEIEKQLIHQQLAISKNQLEPHFMLNTLNNIGYMFTKDDKQQAMYYFGKFAALIRRGLMYADKVETTLEKEIEFIEDYLILQKHLMDGELDFSIENKEDIDLDKIYVPHALIYTFVENAIKHGLRPKEKDRSLRVEIIQIDDSKIKITIIDNGIGRKKSKELGTTDTGKGMEIVKSIVVGYNKLYGGAISYEIRDLVGEGDVVLGTEVVVLV